MADTEISKEVLQKEIAEILQNASLDKTSTKKVIQKLEKKLGVDLTDKKKMIDQLVMDYVNSMDTESEEESEEEKPVKKSKSKKAKDDDEEEEEERDDSNDSDWGSGKKKTEEKKKKASPKSKKGGGGVTKKGGKRSGSGYTRALKLSPALSELMGVNELPRHEVVKRVWAIIKEKQLFDPNNRQFAICDKALYKVIGEKRFHTFSMMKYLKTHFID